MTYEKVCAVCGTPFQSNIRSQKYCSRICYRRAYHYFHPEKSRDRGRDRRAENPAWYREKEPIYYQNYRTRHTFSQPWLYIIKSAKRRAIEKGLEFDLTAEWAVARWTGRCEITGLAFTKNEAGGPHPYSPTIDRIDPNKGYTQDNSRFIIWGCNAIKGVGSDSDMYRIAKHITLTSLNAITAEALLSLPA